MGCASVEFEGQELSEVLGGLLVRLLFSWRLVSEVHFAFGLLVVSTVRSVVQPNERCQAEESGSVTICMCRIIIQIYQKIASDVLPILGASK